MQQDKQNKANTSNLKLWISIGSAALFVIVVVAFNWSRNSNLSNGGLFGDSFGWVNALFTGAAFIGVIAAVFLQSRELFLQREELADTREVLKDQKAQLEAQANILTQQSFEQTLFNLLNHLNSIVDSTKLRLGSKPEHFEGRSSFFHFYREFIKIHGATAKTIKNPAKCFENSWQAFLDTYKDSIESYLNVLETILDYVSQENISREKNIYYKIIRSLLSQSELCFCYNYGLSEQGSNYKILIEESSLFSGLEMKFVHVYKEGAELYEKSAFGE